MPPITIINQMREGESWKARSNQRDDQLRESEQIMRKIGQLREGASYASNSKQSDIRERWYQYLPAENARSGLVSTHSKEDNKPDHYRQSLQKRLEKLFKEEKDLLKERHYGHQPADSISKQSQTAKQPRGLGASNSIDNMQRKIRQLEEKYRASDIGRTKVPARADRKVQTEEIYIEPQRREGSTYKKQSRYLQEQRDRTRSEYVRMDHNELTSSVQHCALRERQLEHEVSQLKQCIRQIKSNNETIMRKIHHREQRRKHKQRTKEILVNILHKLEFINVEVANAKKRDAKTGDGTAGRMEREATHLMGEFQLLKVQYRHLEEERKKVEVRQEHIEDKLRKLVEEK